MRSERASVNLLRNIYKKKGCTDFSIVGGTLEGDECVYLKFMCKTCGNITSYIPNECTNCGKIWKLNLKSMRYFNKKI